MLQKLLSEITVVQGGIMLTLIFLLLRFRKNNVFYLLLSVLILFVLTESLAVLGVVLGYSHGPVYNASIVIHNLLWLRILLVTLNKVKLFVPISSCYIAFAIFNLVFLEGPMHFNVYTFVLGALIYLALFLYENIYQLKNENFEFTASNDNLLLSTPLFLFITISAVTGFHDTELADYTLVSNIPLYSLVNTFGNLIYYSLINVYIYRINKLQYA